MYGNDGSGHFNTYSLPQPWPPDPLDRHGAIILTLDEDTDLDIFIAHGGAGGGASEANEVYRNDSGGSFANVALGSGLDDPEGRSRAASAADFNGDRRVDLWVGKAPRTGNLNSVFRNDGALMFTDVASFIGLAEPHGTVGGIWGDVDDDGDPDLLVGGEEFPRPTILSSERGRILHECVVHVRAWGVAHGFRRGLRGHGQRRRSRSRRMRRKPRPVRRIRRSGYRFLLLQLALRGHRRRRSDDPVHRRYDAGAPPRPGVRRRRSSCSSGRTKSIRPCRRRFFSPTITWGLPRSPQASIEASGCGGPRPAVRGNCAARPRFSTPMPSTVGSRTAHRSPGVTPHDLEDPGFVPGGPRVWRNDGTQFSEVTTALGLPGMLNPRDVSWVDYDNDGDLDLHVVDMGTSAFPNAPDALFRNDGAVFSDVTAFEGSRGRERRPRRRRLSGATWTRTGTSTSTCNRGPVRWRSVSSDRRCISRMQGSRGNVIAGRPARTRLGAGGSRGAVDGVPYREAPCAVGCPRIRGGVSRIRSRSSVGLGGAVLADSMTIEWPAGTVDTYLSVAPGAYRFNEGRQADEVEGC